MSNAEENKKKYKAPRISVLIEQVRKGTDPECIVIPEFSLTISDYMNGKEYRSYYYDQNDIRHQIQTHSGNKVEAEKIARSKIINEVRRVSKEMGYLGSPYLL